MALSAKQLHHAIEVGNISHRAGGQHKYHAIKQWKNTINQHNHNLPLAWLYRDDPLAQLGFLRVVFLANHLASTDNLIRTTKRQNTY